MEKIDREKGKLEYLRVLTNKFGHSYLQFKSNDSDIKHSNYVGKKTAIALKTFIEDCGTLADPRFSEIKFEITKR